MTINFKVVNNGSDITYIYLSSLGTKPGFFSFFKIAQKNHGNYVFLNDSDNNWYLEGIKGLSYCSNETILKIQDIILDLGAKENVFIGDSMGAYGALFYGLSIKKTTKILAISPELELGVDGGLSKHHLNKIDYSENIILELIKNNKKIRIEIISGELFSSDIYTLIPALKINNCNITSIKNSFHTVSLFIHNSYGLHNLIHDIVHDKSIRIPNKGDLLDYPELVKQFYYSERKKVDIFNFVNLDMSKTKLISNETLSLFFYLKYFSWKEKDTDKSIVFLRCAASLNPANLVYCKSLIDLSIKSTIESSLKEFDSRLMGQPKYRELLKYVLINTDNKELFNNFVFSNSKELKKYSEFNFASKIEL
jgi:hypothetical protein